MIESFKMMIGKLYELCVSKTKLYSNMVEGFRPLAEVSDFDSVGVQLLLLLRRDAEKAARRLRLAAPSESVQGLLKLFGLFEYFPLIEEGSLS